MVRKQAQTNVDRNVALCYIRRSWVKDEKDLVSPQIQRQHIQRVCETHEWIMEWYEDADGHKSGMHEKNRPGWLALKARMSDPDVVAIVAYDLSRLHRKGWRIGDLLDFVDSQDIRLVLADPNKNIDFSTPQGRLMAQLAAIFDEYYAIDISLRRKANIAYKKAQNKTIGIPPFGTKRDQEGYLIPSDEGAWLMPDGSWQAGKQGEPVPIEGAIWRGYYDCAHRILELYVTGKGPSLISKLMSAEGWAFRTRYGQPSPLEKPDVLRATRNWIEYGGTVIGRRAKDRPAYDIKPDEIPLNPERAVFDVALLRRVGQIATEKSFRQPDRGRKNFLRIYPLVGLIYCAKCDQMAQRQHNPKLRSILSGKNKTDENRGSYRHRPGLECGCTRKQVSSADIEGDFLRLCQLLTVDERALTMMQNLAAQFLANDHENERAMMEHKAAAIAKCERRITAARHIFENGDIGREEYLRRKANIERDLAYWQNYTTETEKLNSQLAMCVDAVTKISVLWANSTDEDRRGLAHTLFDEIVYDLDTQRIVSFQLKEWADQFLVVCGALYEGGNDRYSYTPSRTRTYASASGGQRSIH